MQYDPVRGKRGLVTTEAPHTQNRARSRSECLAILELLGRCDADRIPLLHRITRQNGEVFPQNQLHLPAN